MLLDCLSIPTAMVLETLFLKRHFGWVHLTAALVCLIGLIVLVIGDAVDPSMHHSSASSSSGGGNSTLELGSIQHPAASLIAVHTMVSRPSEWSLGAKRALGDTLCVLGSILYASNNVAQEALVRGSGGPLEYLGMLGAFGVVVSAAQVAILEPSGAAMLLGFDLPEGSEYKWWYMAGFAVCLGGMYILTSLFLRHADAAFFNISLLSSDAWAAFAAAIVFGDYLSPWYWASLAIVVSGALVFHLVGGDPAAQEDDSSQDRAENTNGSNKGEAPEEVTLGFPPRIETDP